MQTVANLQPEPTLAAPMATECAPVSRLSLDDSIMKTLVRDLHRASRTVFWTDLLVTSVVGWSAFVAAVALKPFSLPMLASLLVATCALYRALCFMHEITHQSRRTLPGFETAWNWLVGFPLLMPAFVYVGVHQDHHRINSYGTKNDPEYLPFAHDSKMTTVFALESFLIPLALFVRFVVLSPVGLVWPRFQRALVRCGSALTMNVRYRREASDELIRKVRRDSTFILAMWAALLVSAVVHLVPWRALVLWLVVDSLISFVNTLRTLGAHAYENEGAPLDRTGQLLDSIDTPGAVWTELWAPVGLRYHALHHYFPGIPYHNLPQAYRRVVSHLPVAGSYKVMTSRSLPHSLRELLRKGMGIWTNSRLGHP
jgi:fatty acid desaturase